MKILRRILYIIGLISTYATIIPLGYLCVAYILSTWPIYADIGANLIEYMSRFVPGFLLTFIHTMANNAITSIIILFLLITFFATAGRYASKIDGKKEYKTSDVIICLVFAALTANLWLVGFAIITFIFFKPLPKPKKEEQPVEENNQEIVG